MIQYKLEKEYPGHTLGEIHCSDKSTKWYGTNFYDAYPEFWQKVEEVDYEILSFYCKDDSSSVFKICENKMYTSFYLFSRGTIEKQELLDSDEWDIQSVKRLSDGEVFTIGDEISTGHFTKNAKIDRIAITTINYQLQGIWVSYKGGSCALSGITKVKKTPLFTTEDGVEIFENDEYYFINNGFMCVKSFAENLGLLISAKTFHSEEKAEEYILLNKPCLSLNDLLSAWGNTDNPRHTPLFRRFESIAKSKL